MHAYIKFLIRFGLTRSKLLMDLDRSRSICGWTILSLVRLMLYTRLASPVAVCIAIRGIYTRLAWLSNPNPNLHPNPTNPNPNPDPNPNPTNPTHG